MKRYISFFALLLTFLASGAQSKYGTGGGFNPESPDIPGGNGFYNGNTLVLDAFHATYEGLSNDVWEFHDRVLKKQGLSFEDFCNQVTQVIVYGDITSMDNESYLPIDISYHFPNMEMLDLSHTYGNTYFESWGSYDNLRTLILPSCIEGVGVFSFEDMPKLTDVYCYAELPPALGEEREWGDNYIFERPELITVHVPTSSVALYKADKYWGKATIVGLDMDVSAFEVKMPAGTDLNQYRNMSLVLTDEVSGETTRYTLSNRQTYYYTGLLNADKTTWSVALTSRLGTVVCEKTGLKAGKGTTIVQLENPQPVATASAKVEAAGTDVTAQVSLTWYDPKTGSRLTSSQEVGGLVVGDQVAAHVQLLAALARTYSQPADQTLSVGQGGGTLTFTLAPMKPHTLTALITDANTRQPLPGITVTAMQTHAPGCTSTFSATTGMDGRVAMEVMEGPLNVSFSSADYLRQEVETSTLTAVDGMLALGTVSMKPANGQRITLKLTSTEPALEGLSATRNPFYADYADVQFSLYNQTRDEAVSQFSTQYPVLVVMDGADENDEILVTVSSATGKFEPFTETVSLQDGMGSLEADIVLSGGFRSVFKTTKNARVVTLLYDADGQLAGTYRHKSAAVQATGLAEGSYTLIVMADDPVLGSLSSLEAFEQIGLEAGRDYVKHSVDIRRGVIALVESDEVPPLDADGLKVVSNASTLSVAKPSLPQGEYVAVRSRLLLKDKIIRDWRYSDFKFVMDIPEGCTYMENSLMVNSQQAYCTVDDGKLYVDVSELLEEGKQADICFCLITSRPGSYVQTAMLQYEYNWEDTYLAPIGTIKFEVTDLKFNIAEKSINGNLAASGDGPKGAVIKVFDGEALVSQSIIEGNTWKVETPMPDAYNLSVHPIRVECHTADGQVIQSPVTNVQVDRDQIGVSKVTMLYPNAWHRSTLVVDFDFINPSTEEEKYDFDPTCHDFTFLVNFTKNDPSLISDVELDIITNSGNTFTKKAVFDEERGCWVATYNNGTEATNLPVNVVVYYNSVEEQTKMDRQYMDDVQSETADLQTMVNRLVGILASANEDNIDEKIAAYEAVVGHSLSATPSDEMKEWEEWFNGLSDEEAQAEADRILTEAEEMVNSMTAMVENCLKGIPDQQGNMSYTLEDGSTMILSDCSKYTESQMEAQGFTKQMVNDGSFIYLLEDASHSVVVDFKSGVAIEIVYAPTGVRQRRGAVETCQSAIESISGIIENVTGAFNEIMGNLAKTTSELLGKSVSLLREEQHLSMLLYSNKLSLPQTIVCKTMLFRTRLSMASNDIALKVAGKLPGVLRKIIPVASYVQLGVDLATKCKKIIQLYRNIPDPCEDDEPAALGLKMECDNLALAVLGFTTAKLAIQIASDISAATTVAAAPETGGVTLLGTAFAYIAKTAANIAADWAFGKYVAGRMGSIQVRTSQLECDEDDDDEGGDDDDDDDDPGEIDRPRPNWHFENPGRRKRPLIDPSGYVCEAVGSNRLEGVTATCYFMEEVEDMYGVKSRQVKVWDAENYGQRNPLLTDAQGMYSWMVPEGNWQVVYEKDGYETARSAWLPVPPPQLDVNVGMVRYAQPELSLAQAFERGIDLDFSLFMKTQTVSDLTVTVTQDGKQVEGTLSAIDGEEAFDGSGIMLASKFRFKPKKSLTVGSQLTVKVNGLARSYAGISMGGDEERILTVGREVTSIGIEGEDSLVTVAYGGTHQVIIAAQSAAAAAYRKVTVTSVAADIVGLETTEVVLDAQGKAYINLIGLLPGTSYLTFAVEDSRVSGSVPVHVSSSLDRLPSAPKASLISGMYVASGTLVELTADEGCTIWYTLDGSCPCDEATRQRYTSPIAINANTKLRAMAVAADGTESEQVTFAWFIATAVDDLRMASSDADAPVYDLSGRRIGTRQSVAHRRLSPGIYISRQKKMVVK